MLIAPNAIRLRSTGAKVPALALVTLIMALLAAGCSSTSGGGGGDSSVIFQELRAAPMVPEVGQQITLTGSASSEGGSSTTWTAVRDGTVTVASGVLTFTVDGAATPFFFTDTIATPGVHRYVVSLAAPDRAINEEILDLSVVYNVSPSMQVADETALTLTLTNDGVGNVAFAIPYSLTTQGLASGATGSFDFSASPLAPGASRSTTLLLSPPVSGTFTFTVDPEETLGVNLAGSPAEVSLPFGSG